MSKQQPNTLVRNWPALSVLAKEIFDKQPTHRYQIQFLRSLGVSFTAFVADFTTLVVLAQVVHLHYLLAATIGFMVGGLLNFYFSAKWVFAHRQFDSWQLELTVFFLIMLVGLGLNLLILHLAVERLGMDYRVAKLWSTLLIFGWNFSMRKKLLY